MNHQTHKNQSNFNDIRDREGEGEEDEAEKVLEKMMVENFPNLLKRKNLSDRKTREMHPRHITAKSLPLKTKSGARREELPT